MYEALEQSMRGRCDRNFRKATERLGMRLSQQTYRQIVNYRRDERSDPLAAPTRAARAELLMYRRIAAGEGTASTKAVLKLRR